MTAQEFRKSKEDKAEQQLKSSKAIRKIRF